MIIDKYSEINKDDETLRLYQRKAKKEIFEAWDEVDSVMFQMPTGTGKTRLFTSIIRDINDYSKQRKEAVKILIIAHRTELIDQIDKSLDKYNVAHNVIVGGKSKNYKKPVNVASIQTITNKSNLEKATKLNVQFVIIDEAHHALAKTYKKLWQMYPDARFLGVTATPWRMNHESFTDLFDRLILSMPVKDFINQGYLAPYKYFSLKSDSDIQRTIDDIELDKFGEYKESSMEEKMDIGRIRAQLLDSYLSLAEGKKGIIYAINIKHANHICEEYKNEGYNAVSIDSKTPAAERKHLVEKFKKGDIDIIVNVDIFSEGFDCPDIEFIQLARPTRSLVKYLQQVGRGLRITENKQDCVILDNVGMYSRFGLPNARRHWKQHFLGKKIDETPVSVGVSFGGSGRSRDVDMSEGTEDMELIQDLNDEVENVAEVDKIEIVETHDVAKEVEEFNPMPLLEANNYKDENFVFWSESTRTIYEAYIQDDKYYIISELTINRNKRHVHRKRVGKIPTNSWMFWQMEREKVDNLKSIIHYGGYFSVFHYRVLSKDGITKDKFFDYKGREISSPVEVEKKYKFIKIDGQVDDFIDVPVSKAKFLATLKNTEITVYRTLQGVTKPIAKFSVYSDFGKHYFFDSVHIKKLKKEMGLKKIGDHNSDKYTIYRSDDVSFTVRCVVNGTTYLYNYDLHGRLVKKGTVAKNDGPITPQKPTLSSDNIYKLHSVFDKKATSYKYFWFLSIMQLFIEKGQSNISFKDITIRMITNAWSYICKEKGVFAQIDQIPKYVNEINERYLWKETSSKIQIEGQILYYYERSHLDRLLAPLLNNVPYRFLSPWIPFTSNEDVVAKSNERDSDSPYSIHDDCIVINPIWREYLKEHYNEIVQFIEKGLRQYLRIN